VTPIRDLPVPRAGTAVSADVVASAGVRATIEEFAALRQRPGPSPGVALPASLLRHADEQTIAGLAAVLRAIQDFQMNVADFRDWGIVAAPCFLGRAAMAVTLQRLAAEGAWGISPHVIPHRSQHAVAGSISQVLKIFGPNLGAGGGPGSVVHALLAGSVLLHGEGLRGVWIVATEWEPEAIPDANGGISADAVCHAVALAVVAARPGWQGLGLRVLAKGAAIGPPNRSRAQIADTRLGVPTVSRLQQLLTLQIQDQALPFQVVWPLDGGGWIEFVRGEAGRNGARRPRVQWGGAHGLVDVQQSGVGTENKR
jgi:hypothetical protein